MSRPIVVIVCMDSSSESWEPYQRPHPWHSRAGWRSRPQHQKRTFRCDAISVAEGHEQTHALQQSRENSTAATADIVPKPKPKEQRFPKPKVTGSSPAG